MRTLLLSLSWVFVVAVASYDMAFAWQYRLGFELWEMNPVARWVGENFGLLAVFGYKGFFLALSVGLGVHMHLVRHRIEVPYTVLMAGIHLYLSLHYLLSAAA